jgi:predicted HTH domain antitoxin
MTISVEVPTKLAASLGPEASRISREALGLEALREGLWTESELAEFLGLSRLELDRFLKDRQIYVDYTWEEFERDNRSFWNSDPRT